MHQEFEKIERKKKWWQDLLTVFMIVYFTFFPNAVFRPRPVFALTENAGTDFTACSAGATFTDNGEGGFDVTFFWVFDVQQNDYFDDDGLPLSTPPIFSGIETNFADNSEDVPVMAAATQASYWIEIDDNSNFSSPLIQTGEVSSTDEYYFYDGGLLTVDRTWFWRFMVKDSYNSQTDWIEGGSFSFGTKTILKGKIKLKGDIYFKFP